MIQAICEVNKKEFSFEEAANPTIPDCKIIFEFGLADAEVFSFVDEEEAEKALDALAEEPMRTMDFFCVVRYYKGKEEKSKALKFDYYLLRTVYSRRLVEMQVFHKKGLRYISPEDLTLFLATKVNEASKRKILSKQPLPEDQNGN